MAENPLIAQVLLRYPDVQRDSLNFPPDSADWTEKDLDLFVGSGGFLKPKKKPMAAAAAAPKAATPKAPMGAPSPAAPVVSASESQQLLAPQAPASSSSAIVVPLDAPRIEVGLMKVEGNRGLTPLTTFMDDVGPNGLKLVSLLNKCERMRSVALMKGANFDLTVLKERYGTGILLREFALEVSGPLVVEIMSVLWCETVVELPCSPFIPIKQALIPAAKSDGEACAPLCTGRFNLVMLDVTGGSMRVLEDQAKYNQVADPLRQALGIPRPTGKEGVPKFPKCYPARGRPFKPLTLQKADCTIIGDDCDMYRVIFHPQVARVCERVNLALDVSFRDQPGVALYANLSKPASAGDRFETFVFVEPPFPGGPLQHRVLYLFAARGGTSAADCAMAIFVVYGPPPGALTSEDVSACGAQRFAALHRFALGGGASAATAEVDLTACRRA